MVGRCGLFDAYIQSAVSGGFGLSQSSDTSIEIDYEKVFNRKKDYKGLRKKYKDLINNEEDSIDFELAKGWLLTRLGNIVTYINGYSFTSSETAKGGKGLPVIKSQNIGKKVVEINHKTDFVENPTKKMLSATISNGDLLMVMSSQSSNVNPLGVTAYYDIEFPSLLNQRVLSIRSIEPSMSRFLYYYLNSFKFHYELSHKSGGSAQANLKIGHIMEMPVALPPLEEQKRIVEKLDEILPLIDELEKDEIKLKDLMQHFPQSMESSILKAAIQGKLIVQKSDDVEDSSLQSYYFNNRDEFEKSEYYFDLPDSWVWSKLDLILNKQDKSKIKAGEAQTIGKHKFYNSSPVQSKYYDEYLYDGEGILFGTGGVPSVHYINEKIAYSTDCILYSKKKEVKLYMKYVYYSIRAMHDQLTAGFKGATIKHISHNYLKEFIIPIPPMQEQINIVKKIEDLLPLVAKLNEDKQSN